MLDLQDLRVMQFATRLKKKAKRCAPKKHGLTHLVPPMAHRLCDIGDVATR